ncbi:gamma-glutamylaminecyclotransferase B-like isoform X2 [Asterias rubens]|uniref:gamma-glutamylaminecyclotransferase B-like isoform X2 n=1 Tax=Asterias rubens TaxID=7604 RepID=UPI00145570D6|nr:gamma-glutamylaminecyclotransferase B-like isoform X2 [Asterias rubens]
MALHRLFVYGTLKRGQPNHEQFAAQYGVVKFAGLARTVNRWPLIIASRCNIPYMLDKEGHGNHVEGEIYDVDDKMLQHCDEFEGSPDYYQRVTIQIQLTEDSGGTKVDWEPSQDVMVYVLGSFKESLLELPLRQSYDSNGEHGLKYTPSDDDISSPDEI